MDAHLRHRQHQQRNRRPRPIDLMRAHGPERGDRQSDRECEAEKIPAHFEPKSSFLSNGLTRQAVDADVRARVVFKLFTHGNSSGGRVPTR